MCILMKWEHHMAMKVAWNGVLQLVWEMPNSNLGQDTNYTEWCSLVFSLYLYENAGRVCQTKP
jgi:hypothetical protein